MVSEVGERILATGLEVVGIVTVLWGIAEIGNGNPVSSTVLIPLGSALFCNRLRVVGQNLQILTQERKRPQNQEAAETGDLNPGRKVHL